MNTTIKLFFLLLLAGTNAFGKGNPARIVESIDWKTFLAKHDLIWEQTPTNYFNAPFLGNGLLGTVFYANDENKLRFDIGRTDVVEHRNSEARSIVDNGRLPIGHFTLETNYALEAATGRLDLFNAEADFLIGTKNNHKVNLRAIVLKNYDAILIEYKNADELQCNWMFHPEASIVPRNPKVGTRYLNPSPTTSEIDGINVCTQNRDAGGSYSTAWKVLDVGNGVKRLIISVEDSYPGNEAQKRALEKIKQLATEGEIDKQMADHRNGWNQYYKKSFISIPHAKMESMYWINQYKFASMMRKGGPLCDLMGPWYKTTIWPGIWFNMNTQMLYSSLHISNQLELAATLPDYLQKKIDVLISTVR